MGGGCAGTGRGAGFAILIVERFSIVDGGGIIDLFAAETGGSDAISGDGGVVCGRGCVRDVIVRLR